MRDATRRPVLRTRRRAGCARCRMPPPARWRSPRRVPGESAAPDRASTRPRGPGTLRRQRPRRGPAPGPRTAQAPRRRPRPAPAAAWARCHARRSGSACGSVASASAACSCCLLGERRRPVDRRTHQRMPEPHPPAELDQPRLHRRARRLDRDAQPPGRPPHQRPVTGRIGRRQLQQQPRLGRQSLQLAPEAVLDQARQRRGPGQAEPARQLRRAQPAAAPAAPADYPASQR